MRGIFPHHHELFGIFEGKRPQQDGVDDAEDRAIRTNAEGESGDSDYSEPRVFQERTQAITQILCEICK